MYSATVVHIGTRPVTCWCRQADRRPSAPRNGGAGTTEARGGVGLDGRYANPAAEGHYQQVVSADRAARAWLVSGQVALGGAAALFVVELLKDHGTTNIPFQGLVVAPTRTGTHVGWQVRF